MGRRENLETRLRLRFFQRSWQNFCLGEGGGAEWGVWIKNGMSPCKVSLVFLPHFDVFCDLLLNWPTVHGIFLYYTKIRKKKTAYLEPRDYSKICDTLGIWKSQTVVFVSASSFTLFHWQTVSSKSFSTSSLAQSRIMAKTFCKTASLSCKKTCHVCDLQLRLERWHSQVVKNSFRLRFSIFLFRKKLQLNVIRGPK